MSLLAETKRPRWGVWVANNARKGTAMTTLKNIASDCADISDWIVWTDDLGDPVDMESYHGEYDYDIRVCNRDALCARLDEVDTGDDYRIIDVCQPGHYRSTEVLIVRPGSDCARELERAMVALETYPLLDDDLHSQRESEAAADDWTRMSWQERIAILAEADLPILAARRDSPHEALGYHCDHEGVHWHREHGYRYVAVAADDATDSHAATYVGRALDLAGFDAGTRYELWAVWACDDGSARLSYHRGRLCYTATA